MASCGAPTGLDSAVRRIADGSVYAPGMREVAPGLYDWTTFHERIERWVHSHYDAPTGTLIDPRIPEEGVEAVGAIAAPARIVLTNRHHLRHADRFAAAYGCEILCHEAGLHEFEGGAVDVGAFAFGDELAPGVRVVEVGALTPEEAALHLARGPGFLALADIVGLDDAGELGYFDDYLLGDDPEQVKRDMDAALARLLAQETFDGLLLAHGDPFPTGGRSALERFLAGRGR